MSSGLALPIVPGSDASFISIMAMTRIESGRYGNDSEYFRDLIRRDQDKRQAEQDLLALIQEGLDSGVSTSTVHDIMKRLEDRLKKNGSLPTHS